MKFINIFFLIFIFSCSKDRELPIYGRSEIVKNETNEGLIYDTIHHTIKEFEFINQDSLIVNNETFKNSIYVADFFFTTCPTICPVMKNNLIKIKRGIILFGNESRGINKKLEKHINQWISIKKIGGAESLNVSVSCGIILNKLFGS